MNNVLTPRQTFNQQREAAKVARQTAMQPVREMQDIAKRRAAKESVMSSYKNAVEKARDAFMASRGKAPAVGATKVMKSGGTVSASKRADGCAVKGKTRGRIV